MVLCYHNVVPDGFDARRLDPALHLDVGVFAAQMTWLRRHTELVPLADVVARLRTGQPVRNRVCVTFDDGYTGVFTHALPVLRDLGIPATVFLVTSAAEHTAPFWWDHPELVARASPERRRDWLNRLQGDGDAIARAEGVAPTAALAPEATPASWTAIRAQLGPDLAIGAHTARHRALPTLAPAELAWELSHGAAEIETHLGTRPTYLAYPYGAWNQTVREAAHAAGYEAAFTLDGERIGALGMEPLSLPRINVPGGITLAAFEAWVSGLRPRRREGT